MSIDQDARRLMKFYPKVFFACHTRHVRDAKTDELVAQQVRILEHLDDLDGTPLCTLAEHLGVTPSTLSLTVDRLERKGYVAHSEVGATGGKSCSD